MILLKKSSIISYSRNALEKIHTDIEKFAEAEHLTAHANSIKVRFEKSKRKGAVSVMQNRIGSCKRKTKETDIELTINLDGQGKNQIDTGIPFFGSYAGWICKTWII